MTGHEEELHRQIRIIQRLVRIALFGKKVIVHGEENFVPEGPNILVGNHIGSYKDVATLLSIVPRDIYFTANQMIFDYSGFNRLIRSYLSKSFKEFGLFLYEFMTPLRIAFVNYVSTYISRIGTIPVDLEGSRRGAINRCRGYLAEGKAVVLLQGKGRIDKSCSFPYVSPFRRGAAIMSYNLLKENDLSVPVTPIAFFGTHLPYVVPARIHVNVGPPLHIEDFWAGDFPETVERFSREMEKRVRSLFREIVRP